MGFEPPDPIRDLSITSLALVIIVNQEEGQITWKEWLRRATQYSHLASEHSLTWFTQWTTEDNDNFFSLSRKERRGGRKKERRKKTRYNLNVPLEWTAHCPCFLKYGGSRNMIINRMPAVQVFTFGQHVEFEEEKRTVVVHNKKWTRHDTFNPTAGETDKILPFALPQNVLVIHKT